MPFSFKPDIANQQQATHDEAPVASFGSGSTQDYASRKVAQGKSIIELILIVIFGITALLALSLIGYKYFLSSQIESKKASLASFESQLATFPLEEMRKLSNRIKIVNQLVKEHPSANVAFRIVEDSIEHHVTYKRFDLRYGDSMKSYQLQLDGVAPDYKGVAQQVDTLKRKPYTTYIQNVLVDGLQPDTTGKITFGLRMGIGIMGLLSEDVNLSDEALVRVASSTQQVDVSGTTTQTVGTSSKSQ
ncbi:MAG: hypothetical protein RIQ41_280 [Candidatus Parcubacteria bacterium]|jgi:hypothetical protein